MEDFSDFSENEDIDYSVDPDDSLADEEPDPEEVFKFDPPLYIQRYIKVCDTIEKWGPRIESLTDFGCAEFKLFQFLKRSLDLRRINLVDVDEDLLQDNLYRTLPLNIEFLKRRKRPLEVNVFVGSAGQPDPRLQQSDVVTAIELIEHLYPDEVETFTYNIFNFLRPKLVIITTPNADFNVVFSDDPGRFRHYDHKFEWSRSQFEDWANNVTLRYPDYTVSFSGIGEAPEGTDNLGGCSQIAVFLHKNISNDEDYSGDLQIDSCETPFGICTYHSLSQGKHVNFHCLKEIAYPYEEDTRTEEEKLIEEIRYRINCVLTFNRDSVEMDYNVFEIPLEHLQPDKNNPVPEEKLEKLLKGYNYVVKKRTRSESTQTETYVVIEEEEHVDSDSFPSDEDDAGISGDMVQAEEGNVSDWDVDDEGEVEGASYFKRGIISEPTPEKTLTPALPSASPEPIKLSPIVKNTGARPKQRNLPQVLPEKEVSIHHINELDELRRRAHKANNWWKLKEERRTNTCSQHSNFVKDTPLEDVKYIINTLLYNVLNMLDIEESDVGRDRIIEFNVDLNIEAAARTNPDLERTYADGPDIDDDYTAFHDRRSSITLPQIDKQQPCCSNSEQNLANATNQSSETLGSMEVGVDPNSEQDSLNDVEVGTIGDGNEFPLHNSTVSWLFEEDGQLPTPEELDAQAYCQGDGLAIYELDDDDLPSETTGSIYTEAEPGPSSQDMSSLPRDDSQSNVTELMDREQQASSHNDLRNYEDL